MTRVLYLDCVGGVAGDMLLAGLVDAGADIELLHRLPPKLGLEGVEIVTRRVERQGIGALQLDVLQPRADRHVRYSELRERVAGSQLDPAIRSRAAEVLARLAEAEARIHGTAVDDVHFHELGDADLLVDICGAMTLMDDLEINDVCCSPLPFTRGLIRSAHGILPSPAPATLALLAGAPLIGVDTEGELVTPTGAAITSTVVSSWGNLPPLVLETVGYGAGARQVPDRPNVLRVLVGESSPSDVGGEVCLLETNLDDFNPELIPGAVESCLAAGALDTWTTSVQMKKGRPGIVLSALARPANESVIARILLEETSTLGVRVSRVHRYELERDERTVAVDGHPIRVKLGFLDGQVVNVAPEHDDCVEVARRTGRSVKAVWTAALSSATHDRTGNES